MKFLDRIFGSAAGTGTTDQTESVQTQVNNFNEKNLLLGGDAPENEVGKNATQRKAPFIGVPVDMHRLGYPIDEIYTFINRDYFRMGYSDALVYGNKEYGDIRLSIIRNELKTLFLQVHHTYNEKIGNIEERIEEAESNMLHGAANRLRRTLATYNEHLATIKQMEEWLDMDDPRMTRMLASYRLGYVRGFIISCGEDINMGSKQPNTGDYPDDETTISNNSKTA